MQQLRGFSASHRWDAEVLLAEFRVLRRWLCQRDGGKVAREVASRLADSLAAQRSGLA
jgi:hypothetical protein